MTFEEEPKGTWCNTCKKWKKYHEDYEQKVKDFADKLPEPYRTSMYKRLGLDK